MHWTDEQYERVARRLDGEAVELTSAEEALAAAVRRGEVETARALDVALPAAAKARARRRLVAALARPRWRAASWAVTGAAAAAVLIAVAIWPGGREPSAAGNGRTVTADVLSEAYELQYQDVDLDLIAEELADMRAELVVSRDAPAGAEAELLEEMLDMFWLGEEPARREET